MRFTPLQSHHWRALQTMLADFDDADEPSIPGYFPARDWPRDRVVETLGAWGRGEQLPEGWVPCTTTFLEYDGELLGLSNVRHHLTPGLERFGGHVGYSVAPSARGRGHATRLLVAAVDFGRSLGLEALLVTCDPANVASSRVIAKCGGQLVDQSFHEGMQREVCRFTIRC